MPGLTSIIVSKLRFVFDVISLGFDNRAHTPWSPTKDIDLFRVEARELPTRPAEEGSAIWPEPEVRLLTVYL